MIITTTSSIEGKNIKEYRGIIFGEAITGIHFIKDFTAGITNFVGGRASEYEEELVSARATAIDEMMKRAKKIGANALIGVRIDIDSIPCENSASMLMVTASGTAVIVEE